MSGRSVQAAVSVAVPPVMLHTARTALLLTADAVERSIVRGDYAEAIKRLEIVREVAREIGDMTRGEA